MTNNGLLTGLLMSLMISSNSTAQPSVEGRWAFVGGPAEVRQLEAAIEAATDDMNRLVRTIARRRLRERAAPAHRMTIRIGDGYVTLSRDGVPLRVPIGSTAVVSANPARPSVRARTSGADLVVNGQTSEGSRHARYRLDGRRLRLTVEIRSSHLSSPVRYRLTYGRVS